MKAVQIQSYKDYPVWGRILRRQEIAGSVLSETAYIPHFSGPRHVHDQVGYFCLTLQGGYTEYLGEYVRRLRVDFACRELSNSRKPLAEIATTAGFCDQAHLSRTLKRFTGMTPVEFRSVFRSS